jgi:hypothetical protein
MGQRKNNFAALWGRLIACQPIFNRLQLFNSKQEAD